MAEVSSGFFAELNRRRVIRVAIAYAIVAFAIAEAADVFFPRLQLPDWTITLVIALAVIGFPVAIVLAWALQVTPEGVQREPVADMSKVVDGTSTESSPPSVDELSRVEASRDAGTTPESEPHAAAASQDDRASIAVLPFENLSDDPDDAYFSDGVTDDILTRLSRLSGIRVISRTSVLQYKGTSKPIPTIARELGVKTVLEGTVRRAGGRVRIVAQLIDAATDDHLWADSYDRDLDDVFAVQSEVAEHIADALHAELSAEERGRLKRRATSSTEAYDLYSKGIAHGERTHPADLRSAIRYFEAAIELDPNYAQAYAGITTVLAMMGFYTNVNPAELFPRMRTAAVRALEIDDSVPEPHVALGICQMLHDRDWDAARASGERALACDSDHPPALGWLGSWHLFCERFTEAEELVRRALRTDPFAPIPSTVLAQILMFQGRFDEASRVLETLLEVRPNDVLGRIWVGFVHLYSGDAEGGIGSLDHAVSVASELPWARGIRGILLAGAGRTDEAEEVRRDLERVARDDFLDPYYLFSLTLALGETDVALDYLEQAVEIRSFGLAYLRCVPRFAPFREHPRFRAVLEQVWPNESFS